MLNYRLMMAAGAAALISIGSARAIEPVDGATVSAERKQPTRDEYGGEPSGAPRERAKGVNADVPDYVRHDELEKVAAALVRRLERERMAQVPAPTFTDAG